MEVKFIFLFYVLKFSLNKGWADEYVQSHISFASYWKDPFNLDHYLYYNFFLADINNEKAAKNATYKKNLSSLNSFTIFYTPTDTIVIPPISPWFYFYKNGSETEIESLKESAQYQYDWIGLKTLDQSKRLNLYSVNCPHTDFPLPDCKQYYDMYIRSLLNNTIS